MKAPKLDALPSTFMSNPRIPGPLSLEALGFRVARKPISHDAGEADAAMQPKLLGCRLKEESNTDNDKAEQTTIHRRPTSTGSLRRGFGKLHDHLEIRRCFWGGPASPISQNPAP